MRDHRRSGRDSGPVGRRLQWRDPSSCHAKHGRVWVSPIVLVQQSCAGFWTLGTLVVTESPLVTDNFSERNTHTSHGFVSGRRVEPPHHFTHFLENTAFGHDFRSILHSIYSDILQDYGLTYDVASSDVISLCWLL